MVLNTKQIINLLIQHVTIETLLVNALRDREKKKT